MNVLVDYTSAVRQAAGIGRLTAELIQRLPRQHPAIRLRLFVSGRRGQGPRRVGSTPVHYTPLRERDMTRLWHRADSPVPKVEWFAACRPRIFHATDFVLPPSQAPCQILTVHDLAFRKFPEASLPALDHYLNVAVPRSVRRADFIIADSHSTAHDVSELWRVARDRVAVVPGGVDRRQFREIQDPAERERVRARYGIGSRPYILGLSTLQPRKNFARLVQAFHRLAADLPDHILVLGGKRGWRYKDILEQVLALGLQARVLFPGFLRDEDRAALYSEAHLFAYPSLYEGFGLPILEAMACGTPVLTGRNSSLAEAGGPGALYVNARRAEDIAEGMWRLITDHGLRQSLKQAGLRHAARRTWDASARRLWQAYRQALDLTGTAP